MNNNQNKTARARQLSIVYKLNAMKIRFNNKMSKKIEVEVMEVQEKIETRQEKQHKAKPTKKKTSWNLKFILSNLHRNIGEYIKPMTQQEFKENAMKEYKKYNINMTKIKKQYEENKSEMRELSCEAYRNEDEETGKKYLNIIDGMEKEKEKKLKLKSNEIFDTINKLNVLNKKMNIYDGGYSDGIDRRIFFNYCRSDTMNDPSQAIQSQIDLIYRFMYFEYTQRKNKNCVGNGGKLAQKACVEAQKFINKLNKRIKSFSNG